MLAGSLSFPFSPLHQLKHSYLFTGGFHIGFHQAKQELFFGTGIPHGVMFLSGLLALGLQGLWCIYRIVLLSSSSEGPAEFTAKVAGQVSSKPGCDPMDLLFRDLRIG